MLRDGPTIDPATELACDVLIVGAGPAGLALAAELDGGPWQVCLLESGGPEIDERYDALSDTAVEPNRDCYINPRYLRNRAVGGTSHRWCINGRHETLFRLGRLDPIDFSHRSWLPHSGWPIGPTDLEPHLQRALALCRLPGRSFETRPWVTSRHQPVQSVSGRVDSPVFLFARRDQFTVDLPSRLAASPNVTLVSRATCVELVTTGGGARVSRARIRTLEGGELTVAARVVVLATGAFEVPRLLLASNGEVPAGLGNGHDLVGRYFTDHQIVKAGAVRTDQNDLARQLAFYDSRTQDGVELTGTLTVAPKTLDDEQILSSALMLVPRPAPSPSWLVQHLFGRDTTSRSDALASAKAIRAAIRGRRLPSGLVGHARAMALGADDLAYALSRYLMVLQPHYSIDQGGWSDPGADPRQVGTIEAFQLCEMAPDPDNRITLGPERDALGMPKAAISFRWGELDRRSVRRAQEIFSEELEADGLGRFTMPRRGGDPLVRQISAHHPAGTTRMARHPDEGVVDPDCRVFGTDNLFVASASVFPTPGYAPPTLTILALALRLADRVKAELERPVTPPLG